MILRRVGHREGEAIDELGVSAFPQPAVGCLLLDLGGDVRKTVFAGIKGTYQPEDLVDRLVVCCANLAPRKMRFGISESMVLAAGPGGEDIFLLAPDSGAVPGQRVH